MKTIKILLTVLVLCSPVFSQASLQWYNIYNGNGNQNDYLIDMTADNSGNIYATGRTCERKYAGGKL